MLQNGLKHFWHYLNRNSKTLKVTAISAESKGAVSIEEYRKNILLVSFERSKHFLEIQNSKLRCYTEKNYKILCNVCKVLKI